MSKNSLFNDTEQDDIKNSLKDFFEQYKEDYGLDIDFKEDCIDISIRDKDFVKGEGYMWVRQIPTLNIDNQDNKTICDVIKEARDLIKKSIMSIQKVNFYQNLKDILNLRRKDILDEIKNLISDDKSLIDEKHFDEEFIYLLDLIGDIDNRFLNSKVFQYGYR